MAGVEDLIVMTIFWCLYKRWSGSFPQMSATQSRNAIGIWSRSMIRQSKDLCAKHSAVSPDSPDSPD